MLRSRVNAYFKQNKRSRFGNFNMVIKTVVMFLIYLTPYVLMLSGSVHHPLLYVVLWMVMGVGMAGIGLSVMHDANHGSYSRKKYVNKYLGFSMNLIGANAEIWKLQHNVLHHTFTNVHGADDDINTPGFLRFSPYDERHWIHRFQFLYVWFFYGVSTLSWVTLKEFVQLFRYKRKGLIQPGKAFRSMFVQLAAWKLFYHAYMLVIPLVLFPVPAWVTLLAFVSMHVAAGLILSLIFQTAHIMPECEYEVAENLDLVKQHWAEHEM
ncbi:MAG: fatty acid desaturase, partial [Bacteroidota bacterium]